MHIACHQNNEDIIRELLHVGAHVNAQDINGLTPLDYLDEKNKGLKRLLRNHGSLKRSELQKSSASSKTDS